MWESLDVVADAEARAAQTILADRQKYERFIAAAELFAGLAPAGLVPAGLKAGDRTRLVNSDDDIIIGGRAATRALVGTGPPVYTLELYSGRAAQHARALADIMYTLDPDGLGHYAAMVTRIAGHQFVVAVDGRDLITVTALPQHRGVRLSEVVIPSERPAQFAADTRVLVMGPELQLMRMYADLCNPARAADWPECLKAEQQLRAMYLVEAKAKIAETVRRAAAAGGAGAPNSRQSIAARLRDEFAADPGRVLVGAEAIKLLGSTDADASSARRQPPGRLQVATSYDREHEIVWLELFASRLSPRRAMTKTIDNLKVPSDPRLQRMTVSFALGRDRPEPVLDVYFTHELIPFTPIGRYRIGTPFALMRFRLADMWTIAVLLRMKVISIDFGHRLLDEMLDGYTAAAAICDDPAQDPAVLLPVSNYVGRAEDAELARKRAVLDSPAGRFVPPPYYPAAAAHQSNHAPD